MTNLKEIARKIIKEQELIIGPAAWVEARKVSGLRTIDEKNGEVDFNNGDSKLVIDRLIEQYEHIFGRASREVCREAVASLVADLAPADIPSSLK